MRYIDVFNGDADGIFSLIQWRKAYPLVERCSDVLLLNIADCHPSSNIAKATGTTALADYKNQESKHILVTGVKRDIALLDNVGNQLASNAVITVLDVSFDKNIQSVQRLINHCSRLFYCDHHKADTLFNHNKLTTHINTEPSVCTGLLINAHLTQIDPDIANPLWAIAAAYGDGLAQVADTYATRLGLKDTQKNQLKQLGVLVNYNGYGSTIDELHFHPATLYQQLMTYDSPLDAINDTSDKSPFVMLQQGYELDMAKAAQTNFLPVDNVIVAVLEDAPWSRRISGTYGNLLTATYPSKPIIVASVNPHQTNHKPTYTISLRAPKNNPYGASTLCSQFATGGGREGAAGINKLPVAQLERFINTVAKFYRVQAKFYSV